MLFTKTIKLLICLLLILTLIQVPPPVLANEVYDHEALMEFEGYGKAVYETIAEQTMFVSGQYTNNKEYVSQTIDSLKDYAGFWWNEAEEFGDLPKKDKLKEMLVNSGSFFLTVGDFVKKLFTDYEEEVIIGEPIHPLADYFIPDPTSPEAIKTKPGYYVLLNGDTTKRLTYFSYCREHPYLSGNPKPHYIQYWLCGANTRYFVDYIGGFETREERDAYSMEHLYNSSRDVSFFLSKIAHKPDIVLTVFQSSGDIEQQPAAPIIDQNYTDIMQYLERVSPQVTKPQPKAYLSCPDDTKIEMAINGSTFLDVNGNVMNVNTDGTAEISSQICNLGWQKQQVQYIDDKAAITDSNGNWLDILTGDLLLCVLDDNCVPAVPPVEEPEPLDNSLLLYVKNAYEYATQVLKTGTDGLKSLAQGAKELTSLFGVFFSWLPTEIVVLMSSGLGIAVGLRLFRK